MKKRCDDKVSKKTVAKMRNIALGLMLIGLIIIIAGVVTSDSPKSGGIVDGDTVWWEVANDFYIAANPHTVTEFSGCQNLTFLNKGAERTIDVAFRFQPEDNLKPVSAHLYNPTEVFHLRSKVCNSDEYGLVDGDTAWCNETVWTYEPSNDTWWSEGEYWEHDFTSFDGETKTIYWKDYFTRYWKDVSHLFTKVSHSSGDVYYVPEVTFTTDQERTLRVCMTRDPDLDMPQAKFDIFMKLSSDSLAYALENDRYVMLDPWQYVNKSQRLNITCDYCPEGMPFLVNRTGGGFDLGNGTEYVWTSNATELYYNNFSDYRVFHLQDVENGSTSSQNAQDVWDDQYVTVLHFANNMQDSKGNSIGATSEGAVFNDSIFSRGLDFERSDSNDRVTMQSTEYGFAQGTIEVWFNIEALGGAAKNYIVTCGANDFAIWYDGAGVLSGFVYDGSTYTVNGATLTVGDWYYLALTYDQADLDFYVNGQLNATDANPANPINWEGSTNCTIGNHPTVGGFGIDGVVDEVRISNSSRSADWINATYQSNTKRLESLANVAPTIQAATLTTTNPTTNETTQNLTLTLVSVQDVNGDAVYNVTDWRLWNGTAYQSIALVNMPFDVNYSNYSATDIHKDYSTYARNGTAPNAASTPVWIPNGQVGSAYNFDGTDSVNIPDSDDFAYGTGNFTATLWTLFNSTGKDQIFFSQFVDGTHKTHFAYNDGTGNLEYYITDAVNTVIAEKAWTPSQDVWYMLSLVKEGTNYYFYVNGTQLGGAEVDADPIGNIAADLRIGYSETFAEGINGSIDQFMIFDRALSSQQLDILYQSQKLGNNPTVLVSQETLGNDSWLVAVTVNDKQAESSTVLSNSVLINEGPVNQTITNPLNGSTKGSGTDNVTWDTFTDVNNDLSFYNITLLNADRSFNQTINSSSVVNYTFINYTAIGDGDFIVVVEGCDAIGLCSNTTSSFTITLAVPNTAPYQPILNTPLNGSINNGLNPVLNVTVTDPDGNNMNVTFYQLNGSLIGTANNISNGSDATFTWSGRQYSTTYDWYVNVTDGLASVNSTPIWNFTTEQQVNYTLDVDPDERGSADPFLIQVTGLQGPPLVGITVTVLSPGTLTNYTLSNDSGTWLYELTDTSLGRFNITYIIFETGAGFQTYSSNVTFFRVADAGGTQFLTGGGGGVVGTVSNFTIDVVDLLLPETFDTTQVFYFVDVKQFSKTIDTPAEIINCTVSSELTCQHTNSITVSGYISVSPYILIERERHNLTLYTAEGEESYEDFIITKINVGYSVPLPEGLQYRIPADWYNVANYFFFIVGGQLKGLRLWWVGSLVILLFIIPTFLYRSKIRKTRKRIRKRNDIRRAIKG